MSVYFVRKIHGNKYGENGIGQSGWQSTEQVTADEPNLELLPANIEQLKPGNFIPVNSGRAGESAAYVLAENSAEALRWAEKNLQ